MDFNYTWKPGIVYHPNQVVFDGAGIAYIALMDSYGAQPSLPHFDANGNPVQVWEPLDGSSTGAIGPTGPAGPAGSNGAPGVTGPQGPTGNTGPMGPVGATGALGPQGPQGAQGPAGAVGNTGPQGNAGAQGAQGPQGAAGPPGIIWMGNWSPATNYFLGDGIAHNGSSYVALGVNTGSEPSALNRDWMLLAAGGAQGPIGATGPVGPAGAAGATGSAGQNLVNLPGTITTVDASFGCPANAKLLGSSLIAYVSKNARGAETLGGTTVVYCRY